MSLHRNLAAGRSACDRAITVYSPRPVRFPSRLVIGDDNSSYPSSTGLAAQLNEPAPASPRHALGLWPDRLPARRASSVLRRGSDFVDELVGQEACPSRLGVCNVNTAQRFAGCGRRITGRSAGAENPAHLRRCLV